MRHFSLWAPLLCLSGFQAVHAQHIQLQPAAAGSSQLLSPGSATPVIEVTSAGGLVLRANVGEAINLQETSGTNVLTITGAGKLRVGTVATGYFLPQTGGTNGQVLTYPGAGNDLIWQTPPAADNLGNHTATVNLNLGANKLVGNGGSSGITLTAAGIVNMPSDVEVGGMLTIGAGTAGEYYLPMDEGAANQVLTSNGGSVTMWANPAAVNNGTAGQVSVFNGTNSTTSSTDLKWDNTNKHLGIGLGAGNPSEALDVTGNGKFSGNVNAAQIITTSNAQVGGSLTVSGNISTNNVTAGGLSITGTSTFNFGANTFTLPATRGTANQVMTADGAGGSNWATLPAVPTVSGTAGQVTYFNGTSSTTSSTDLKWDNTNKRLGIGLGAGSPSEALDVAGNSKISGSLAAGSISTTGTLGITGATSLTGALSVMGNATFSGATNTFNSGANSFSMPTTRGSNGSVLASNGVGGSSWITPYILPSAAAGGVPFYDATGTDLSSNASFFKWDNTNKRLGIGTASPTEALEVGGNMKASGTLSIGGASTLAGTVTLNSGANTFSLPTLAGTAGQLMMSNATTTGWTTGLTWDNTNSRLGFNTNIPLANLHVKQKAATDNASTIYETTANASYASAGVKNSGTSALSVSNATSSGTISWALLTNVANSDNLYASVTTTGVQQSHRIQPLGFFNPVANNVPTGATVTGIMVYIERKANVGSSVKDFAVQLLKSGVTVGTAKSLDEFWTTADATVVYGSPTDTWGASWTVADINAANTGLDFSVTTAGIATASIDQIRMVVYYTLSNASGSAVVWSAGVADGTNKFTVAQDNTIGADQDVFAINPKGDVEIYGNYTYAFPQSRTLTINNAAFTLYSTNVVYDILRQFTNYPVYAYMNGGTQASLGQMVASVSIPDGATITSVSARLVDDITGLTTKVELVRCSDATGTVLASCQLATDQTSPTVVTEYLNHVVDNDLYSYALVFHGSQGASTVAGSKSLLYNVKVSYLTTRAD